MSEKILFDNPPVLEALCEFHFVPSEAWDWTVPGLFYQRVSGDFPLRQQQELMQLQMTQTPGGLVPSTQQGIARMQFLREDRSALLQIGPNQLIVNQLRPYPNWDVFKARIESALSHYVESARPNAIGQILLRYVNRIDVPEGHFYYEDLINTYPNIPGGKEQKWASWAQQVQITREDVGALMTVQSGSLIEVQNEAEEAGTTKQNHYVMLDITFARMSAEPLTLESVSDWIEVAHAEIEKMFVESVTTQSRTLFGEKELS